MITQATEEQAAATRRQRHLSRTDPEEPRELALLYGTKWQTVSKLQELEAETGKSYKKGKFSNTEKKIVMQSIDEWIAEHREMNKETFISSLFNRTERRRFTDFFVKTATKLGGRPVLMVYHYVKRLLHPGNRAGNWTEEEDAQLRRLFVLKGPQWVEISKVMTRFATACRDRYRKIREHYAKGHWNAEETERLKQAVAELIRSRESGGQREEDQALSWYFVSEQVKTRSQVQCITKWSALSFKHRREGVKHMPWTKAQDYQLCHRLYDMGVEDESEIVWRDLWQEDPMWQQYWTPDRLRTRWMMLKRRVLDERKLDMDAILESLLNSLPKPPDDVMVQSDSEFSE